MADYEVKMIEDIAKALLEKGYRVFLSGSKKYGFYTDKEGSKIVSFQTDLGVVTASGNYVSPGNGSGWRMSDSFDVNKADDYFNANPPYWAVKDSSWRFAKLDFHLKQYGESSKYKEVFSG